VEVRGKPFLEHQIELIRGQGLTRILLCVGHRAEQIKAYFGDGRRFGVQLAYSHDGEAQRGTGGALIRAWRKLDPWFAVLDGDSYLPIDFRAVIHDFLDKRATALMTVYRNDDKYSPSNVAIARELVIGYQRTGGNFHYIHYGFSVFGRDVFRNYTAGDFVPMDQVYLDLISERRLSSFVVHRRFYEIGSFEGLADFDHFLKRQNASARSRISAVGDK
jgi:NDP-sugar pyrophosphorylase family protein